MAKHLILIHGRSTKPAEADKRKMVKRALLHGLDRVDLGRECGKAIQKGDVKYSFIYYGDISNQRMLDKNPRLAERLTARDPDHDNAPCEPAERYLRWLNELLDHNKHTSKAYKNFLKQVRDKRWMDNAAVATSWLASLTGLSDNLVRATTADMGAYLMERRVGSAIRQRLQAPLAKALLDGDDICLVSHSMGCMVSYDVLWKFSQMSEYRHIQDTGNRVNLWLTLGNPLGEPGVRHNLYDSNERDDGRFPRHIIRRWINVAAADDFVSHDNTIEDDFAEMRRLGYLEELRDHHQRVYTFWANKKGSNPHKLYGYLDNPEVAQLIAGWMKG